MHERECKGYISFNRGVNEFNRGVNELNRGVNDLNRGVNHSVARQGCNLLRAAVTSAVTSQGCCCGNLQIHPLDLGQLVLVPSMSMYWRVRPPHQVRFTSCATCLQILSDKRSGLSSVVTHKTVFIDK